MFRVWNKQKKRFVDPKNFDWGDKRHIDDTGELLMDFDGNLRFAQFPCGNGDNAADSVFEPLTGDEFVVQRNTGLKDINNKEIYEGDIIKVTDLGCSSRAYKPYIKAVEWKDGGMHVIDSLVDTVEVLGNIFENPELCKEN